MKKLYALSAVVLCIVAMDVGLISPALGQLNHLEKTEQLLDKQAELSPALWVKYQEYQIKWELKYRSWAAVHGMRSEPQKFWQMDTSWLSVPWHNTDVTWVGVGVPICLRAWKNDLYLIVFDRDTLPDDAARFRFYHQTHGVLAEISAKDFPREIATQNLWLRTQNGYRNGLPINEVEIAKALDPASVDFQDSLTAHIWLQCETGKEYHGVSHPVEQSFLEAYLKKYKVVRLLEIQPQATKQSSK